MGSSPIASGAGPLSFSSRRAPWPWSSLYWRLTAAGALLWVGGIIGVFVNGLNGGIGALMSEAHPTAARATAQTRCGTSAVRWVPCTRLVVDALAARYSFQAAIGLLASICLLDIPARVFLIPELRGVALP